VLSSVTLFDDDVVMVVGDGLGLTKPRLWGLGGAWLSGWCGGCQCDGLFGCVCDGGLGTGVVDDGFVVGVGGDEGGCGEVVDAAG